MGRPQNIEAREHILDVSVELFHARGYRGVSMDDVAKRAGLRKSNLFHYYPTKDELALGVIQRAVRSSREQIATQLSGRGDPIRIVGQLFERSAQAMEQAGCVKGCLIGNLAQELSDQSEPLRVRISDHLNYWVAELSEFLRRHKAAGYFRRNLNTQQAADALVALIEGATLLAKANRRADALRHAGAVARHYLESLRA